MDERILYFFEGHMDALPLYERLEQRILNEIEDVQSKYRRRRFLFITGIFSPVSLLQRCGRRRNVRIFISL